MARSAEGDADLTPRAFLVGLRAPKCDDQPLPHALDVAAIERHEFRSPEPAGEAHQEQRTVTRGLRPVAQDVQDRNRSSRVSGSACRWALLRACQKIVNRLLTPRVVWRFRLGRSIVA